jgi:hypothetical protein
MWGSALARAPEGARQRAGPHRTSLSGSPPNFMEPTPNNRTMAEYFIRGLTEGSVNPSQVISWADEVIVAAPKTEDWMLDISTANADDRMGVLHHLHAVQGEIDEAALQRLLAQK